MNSVSKSIISVLVIQAIGSAACNAGDNAADLQRIAEKWRMQRSAIFTAEVEFRLERSDAFYGLDPFSLSALESAVAPILRDDATPEVREVVVRALCGKSLSEIPAAKFVFDGEHVREEYAGDTQLVADGLHVVANSSNHFVEIKDRVDSHRRVLNLRDFRFIPNPSLLDRITDVKESSEAGRLILRTTADNGDDKEYEVDRDTGDVYRYLRWQGATSDPRLMTLQGDFRTVADDVRMPFWRLEIEYGGGVPAFIEMFVVDVMAVNVDIPESEFILPSPVETLVYDYRGRNGQPGRSHRLTSDEPDVVAHVDAVGERLADRMDPPPRGSGHTASAIIVANIIVLLVVAVVLFTRRKRRTAG